MPFPPSALGSLRGRTAPLQVMLVPQEETLEVCAVCKPPFYNAIFLSQVDPDHLLVYFTIL